MSSFASRAREEIAQRSIQKDCCVRAAAYGIACFAKYFDAKGLVVQTEQQETVQAAQQLFARCGVQGEILHKQRPSGVLYEFNIRAPEQVARVHELFGTTGSETSLQIDPRLIRCQTCVSAYIGAAFLCSGTVIDPQKEYNLEPDLRQDRGQCGTAAQLYGRWKRCRGNACTKSLQTGAQPDQPADQL